MIRFDDSELEFAADRSGCLLLFVCADKTAPRTLHWIIEGRLGCVDSPVRRGDLAGLRLFDLRLMPTAFNASHWHELSGQTDERTTSKQLFKAVLLQPVVGSPPTPDDKLSALSVRHRIKLGPRNGYHFLVEVSAHFVPAREVEFLPFGGTDATEAELEAVAQELTIVEHLPLAGVFVRIRRDALDQVASARALAKTYAGLEDLEPWPGKSPDYLPMGTPPPESREKDTAILFVTPWARDVQG